LGNVEVYLTSLNLTLSTAATNIAEQAIHPTVNQIFEEIENDLAAIVPEVTISMDGKGRATNNSCIERFWRSAKCERIYLNEYQSISELITDVGDYIEFYNHRRFHETLAYKKPMDVYQENIKLNQEKAKA
jgi:argonaute-like protein implicated in RNA metabolism and viral defense